jgi:hypothetical protein
LGAAPFAWFWASLSLHHLGKQNQLVLVYKLATEHSQTFKVGNKSPGGGGGTFYISTALGARVLHTPHSPEPCLATTIDDQSTVLKTHLSEPPFKKRTRVA